MTVSGVPERPASRKEVRSGELGLKKGPSVWDGVATPLQVGAFVSIGVCAPVVANGDDAVFLADPVVLTGPAQAAMRKTNDSIRDFCRKKRRLKAFSINICCLGITFSHPSFAMTAMLIGGTFKTSSLAEI